MRAVARAGAALARSGGLKVVAGRGLDLVTQVADAATEAIRSHRDPSLVARRRQVAARRRLVLWSVVTVLLAALGASSLVGVLHGNVTAGSIGLLVLVAGLLLYGLIGLARSAVDLRARTKVVRRLPAPQPGRRSVAAVIRPLVQRLDGYSDALRQAVGMIGIASPNSDMRTVRDETLVAADAAESLLRSRAAELTALLRGGAPRPGTPVAETCRRLQVQIATGVDEYGRLVAAASGAASASVELAANASPAGGIAEVTERLGALAAGMREIAVVAAP